MTNRKSKIFLAGFSALLLFFCAEVMYLYMYKSMDEHTKEIKREFVGMAGLSDLAVSTEASYIRHRSTSSFFAIYPDDGSLREYFASTFVYKGPK